MGRLQTFDRSKISLSYRRPDMPGNLFLSLSGLVLSYCRSRTFEAFVTHDVTLPQPPDDTLSGS